MGCTIYAETEIKDGRNEPADAKRRYGIKDRAHAGGIDAEEVKPEEKDAYRQGQMDRDEETPCKWCESFSGQPFQQVRTASLCGDEDGATKEEQQENPRGPLCEGGPEK